MPALRGFRTPEGLSASVARSPLIGVIFPAKGGYVDFVRLRFCVVFSRELGGAPAALDILRVVLILSFRIIGLLVGRHLVGQVCVACTRLLR